VFTQGPWSYPPASPELLRSNASLMCTDYKGAHSSLCLLGLVQPVSAMLVLQGHHPRNISGVYGILVYMLYILNLIHQF
jgi:hypothetical protein